jgi:hypothetical protein
VLARVDPRGHREAFSIYHAFNDTDGTIQPLVPLILGLKQGVKQLLANTLFKEGATLKAKHYYRTIMRQNNAMGIWHHGAIAAAVGMINPAHRAAQPRANHHPVAFAIAGPLFAAIWAN